MQPHQEYTKCIVLCQFMKCLLTRYVEVSVPHQTYLLLPLAILAQRDYMYQG